MISAWMGVQYLKPGIGNGVQHRIGKIQIVKPRLARFLGEPETESGCHATAMGSVSAADFGFSSDSFWSAAGETVFSWAWYEGPILLRVSVSSVFSEGSAVSERSLSNSLPRMALISFFIKIQLTCNSFHCFDGELTGTCTVAAHIKKSGPVIRARINIRRTTTNCKGYRPIDLQQSTTGQVTATPEVIVHARNHYPVAA